MATVNQRVAITGIGIVSALGNHLSEFRNRLLAGVSAAKKISIFDPADLPTRIAAEVDDSTLPLRTKDRKVGFAILAARSAILNAETLREPLNNYYNEGSGGLSIGIGLELFSMPDMIHYLNGGNAEGDPMEFVQTPSDICVPRICEEHHLQTPPLIHISACAASTDAIGTAFRMIRSGKRNWMLAGGTDSMINPLGVGGFCRIQAMTQRNDDPEKASRPFDRDRDGFLLGEGAAMFVMEPWNDAIARGAHINAEICGYGTSFDAHGISEPHPEGEGAVLAMQRALQDAGLSTDKIDSINAHGTSTPKNDLVEAKAIQRVFGMRAKRIPISSTKSMIGHLISAAGGVETAAAILCSRKGYVHPNINLENPDPDCDLNLVRDHAQAAEVRYFLKNSFAFGGQNATLIVRNVLE